MMFDLITNKQPCRSHHRSNISIIEDEDLMISYCHRSLSFDVKYFDGLRGYAAFMVIIHHWRLAFFWKDKVKWDSR